MSIDKLLLDEMRRERQQRAVPERERLSEEKHGENEPEEAKLGKIVADGLKEKLYGRIMRKLYPGDADEMFERFEANKSTADDLKKFNAGRYRLEDSMVLADDLRRGLADDDIEFLRTDETFDAVLGGVLDKKRAAEIIRDHFYLMGTDGKLEELKQISDAQKELKSLRESPSYARSNEIARTLVEKYGFTPKEWSIIEEGHTTKREKQQIREEVWRNLPFWKKTVHGLLWLTESDPYFSPLTRGVKRATGQKEENAKRTIEERVGEKGTFFRRRTNRVLKQIGKIEDSHVMNTLRQQHGVIGSILAASIVSDEKLMEAIQAEAKSRGTIKAEAVDRTRPMSFEQLNIEKARLNDATFGDGLKEYLKKRVADGEITRTDLGDHDVRAAELDRYQQQTTPRKKGIFGFFVELIDAFRRNWLTESRKNGFVRNDTLWA